MNRIWPTLVANYCYSKKEIDAMRPPTPTMKRRAPTPRLTFTVPEWELIDRALRQITVTLTWSEQDLAKTISETIRANIYGRP